MCETILFLLASPRSITYTRNWGKSLEAQGQHIYLNVHFTRNGTTRVHSFLRLYMRHDTPPSVNSLSYLVLSWETNVPVSTSVSCDYTQRASKNQLEKYVDLFY